MSKNGLCVIVTGSASGLGSATAGILAKGGRQKAQADECDEGADCHHPPAGFRSHALRVLE